MNSSMNSAKGMASSAVSAFANIPAVSETVDKTFNMPGLTKQTSEYLQNKLQSTRPLPPPPPPKADKWPLPAKIVVGIVAIVVLYFFIDGQTKASKAGSPPLSAEDEANEPLPKWKWWLAVVIAIALTLVSIRYLPFMAPLRSWLAGIFKSSPTKSRGTLSSRRSYYPPRSCRYQLRTK